MKKIEFIILLIIVSTFRLFSDDKSIDVFLSNYFDEKQYVLEKHQLADEEIYFAFLPNSKNEIIFRKAIIFKNMGDAIIPSLYFFENEVFNLSEKLLEMNIKTQRFYGFAIHFSDGYNTIGVIPYYNEGKSVTDNIVLEWKNNTFKKYEIDKSLL